MSNINFDYSYEKVMRTGIPAGLASGIALTGLQRQPLVNGQKLIPSKLSCGVFGGAYALGTWMMIDGDYKDGAGFTAVWSTLYLMANRKSLGRGLYASGLWALAAANAVGYAAEFMRADPAIPKTNISPLDNPPKSP